MADETTTDETSSDEQQHQPRDDQEEGACKIVPNFEISFERCFMCGLEHDSPEFGPYCAVCHDFLYPNALLLARNVCDRQIESAEFATSVEAAPSQSTASQSSEIAVCTGEVGLESESEDSGCESENESTAEKESNSATCTSSPSCESTPVSHKLPYLSLYERVRAPDLIAKRLANELNLVEEGLFETLPPETSYEAVSGLIEMLGFDKVLLMIFSFLDDISLCMVGQVCQWWHQLAGEPNQWKKHVLTRWPLFKPDKPIGSWQKLYIKMLQGVTCRRCFEEGCVQHSPEDDIVNSWRNKRLKSELKGLLMDPPEGIRACPLDSSLSYWQASIKGPPECPYEGGLFFLHLEIPKSYPMRPPIVKFITRIFHPNVSYHGDVGIDALRHNWSLALTIPKVLVSIQSLLTDPYCYVSMEPEIADFCEKDREEFDRIARDWTVKYAQLHMTC